VAGLVYLKTVRSWSPFFVRLLAGGSTANFYTAMAEAIRKCER